MAVEEAALSSRVVLATIAASSTTVDARGFGMHCRRNHSGSGSDNSSRSVGEVAIIAVDASKLMYILL